MKNKRPRILVSHSARQYVHHLCFALQSGGYLQAFFASYWYKPSARFTKLLSWLPAEAGKKVEHGLKKRYFKPLRPELISTFPVPELVRQVAGSVFRLRSEKWVLYVEKIHDWHVSRQLHNYTADIIIGYEKSSLKTFKKAKQLNKITILDLAQVHYSHINHLRNQYPDFKSVIPEDALFAEINRIKSREYAYADYIFVLSDYARQTLVEANVPASIIYTLNLGFDPANFRLKNTYNRHKRFDILFVGTITNRKGVNLVLEAFKQLNLTNASLTIVGPMADGEDTLDNYRGWYTYVPFLHHEQLVQYYQQADIFVFPSYLDSWAMTVLEAMACGTPVIVSENTGAKDAVAKGGGYIIPVDDVAALKEKIRFLYTNRQQIELLGRQAHQIAQAYTWDNYYAQAVQAIEDIWQREQTKHRPVDLVPGG